MSRNALSICRPGLARLLPVLAVCALAGCEKDPESPASHAPPPLASEPPGVTSALPPQPAPARVAVQQFEGSLGESFFYAAPLSIEYNPHGSAQTATIRWKDDTIGFMQAIPSPPKVREEVIRDVLVDRGLHDHGATLVDYSVLMTRNGCTFRRLIGTRALENGTRLAYVLFLTFHEPKADDPATSSLAEQFGAYRFEFLLPEAELDEFRTRIDPLVDSFQLPAR